MNQEQSLPEPQLSRGGVELGEALYVATVYAKRPLDRIWAYGLGSRGRATIYLNPDGISIERRGERDLHLPKSSLRGITKERATIDKGVERDGLIAIHWQLGNEDLVTHLRVVSEQQRFVSELQKMTGEAA